MVNASKVLIPSLISGIALGLVGSIGGTVIGMIPCIGCANCLLCFLWPILSGMLGVFLVSNKQPVDNRDGVLIGAMSGAFGGITSAIVGAIIFALKTVFGIGASLVMPAANMKSSMKQAGLATLVGGLVGIPLMIVTSFLTFCFWIIMGALGGMIGVMVFGKK
ncbi:MAG: hypothetical protein ABIH11_01360 [Candidatus Altiarchaeota archaeon]